MLIGEKFEEAFGRSFWLEAHGYSGFEIWGKPVNLFIEGIFFCLQSKHIFIWRSELQEKNSKAFPHCL